KGPANRWLSIISRPLFLPDGSYGGFVGGAVHLQNGNALQNALDKHHFEEGAYFYIVDETGTVVHHPEHNLIGSSFRGMEPVPAVLGGKTGTKRTTDAAANDMLISYAPIPLANWGVVAQRPTEAALSSVGEL